MANDRAIEIVGQWIDDNLPHSEANFGADEGIVEALEEAGYLLPEVEDYPLPGYSPINKGEDCAVRLILGAIHEKGQPIRGRNGAGRKAREAVAMLSRIGLLKEVHPADG